MRSFWTVALLRWNCWQLVHGQDGVFLISKVKPHLLMSLAAKRQFCNLTTFCGMVSKWKWVWSTLVSCDTVGFPYRMIPQTIRGHSEFRLRNSTYCSTSLARRCISKRECLRHGKSRNVRLPRWLIARYGIQRVLLRMSRQASRPPVDRVVNLPASFVSQCY